MTLDEKAERIARASMLVLRVAGPGDAAGDAALTQYYAELRGRFPNGFEPGASGDEPGAHYVVATVDDAPVAYGGIRPIEIGSAEIKRMWVDPSWRGAGLGGRMLRHLEALARAHGFTRVVLDTNGTLREAIALYERAGYRQIARYNDNPYAELFFEKALPSDT